MFEGKKILITGGTGSLGQALTKRLLNEDVNQIRIFSRNEFKQIDMENKFRSSKLRFLIGDIRDYERLERAMEDIDIVFHTAALKHVPKIEYNPFEAIKTNVNGSQNVINACLKENVDRAICVGTDKAVSPLNTYGATKLLMEKLFVTAKNYVNTSKTKTKFIALRYGNVFGSSGSVIPKFIEQVQRKEKITITDPNMTRFSITMNEALDFILNATKLGNGSEIFVPKLRSYSILDVKQAITELLGDYGEEIVGIRPGEKLHETLINSDEIRDGWEIDNMYMISNPLWQEWLLEKSNVENPVNNNSKKIGLSGAYSSDKVDRIPVEELKNIINESGFIN